MRRLITNRPIPLDATSVNVPEGVASLLGMLVEALIIAVPNNGLDVRGLAFWQAFAKGFIIVPVVSLDTLP